MKINVFKIFSDIFFLTAKFVKTTVIFKLEFTRISTSVKISEKQLPSKANFRIFLAFNCFNFRLRQYGRS